MKIVIEGVVILSGCDGKRLREPLTLSGTYGETDSN